jgi:hypothetical protein
LSNPVYKYSTRVLHVIRTQENTPRNLFDTFRQQQLTVFIRHAAKTLLYFAQTYVYFNFCCIFCSNNIHFFTKHVLEFKCLAPSGNCYRRHLRKTGAGPIYRRGFSGHSLKPAVSLNPTQGNNITECSLLVL